MDKRAIFIGRWSPFHKGHLSIMQKKIDENKPLLIFVRNTPYDIYSPELRKEMIEATMEKLKVDAKVMIIDDMESVNYGRGVGYEVNEVEVPENIKRISATEIRSLIEKGNESWREYMPSGADEVLKNHILNSKPSQERTPENIFRHEGDISRKNRNELLQYKNKVLWFTGLSGSGKSTLAIELEKRLHEKGILTYILDGDNVRQGLNKNLGFSKEDREENIRRIGEVTKLFYDAGIFVFVCFISPYTKDRDKIREKIGEDFIEIFADCSLEECEKRDTKGLYSKARKGEIKDFTGISAPYEAPPSPEIVINTDKLSIEESVSKIVEYLEKTLIYNGKDIINYLFR